MINLELASLPKVERDRHKRLNLQKAGSCKDFFSGKDKDKIIQETLNEIQSSSLSLASVEVLEVLRQLSLRSLWFFLKFIAGFSGPYNDLNSTLHLEMANVRQRALKPASAFAAFLPRGFLKSTIWTHGAVSWEILRDPDLRVAIASNTAERALEFLHISQRTFDDNEMMKALFPEFIPSKEDGSRWNDKEAVLPNRSRNFSDPNVRALGALGSTQGVHVGLIVFDDLVGEAQLNSDRASTLEMFKIKNWFQSNQRTLLYPQRTGRRVLSATRYALDDPYEDIMVDCNEQLGNAWFAVEADLKDDYPLKPTGEWKVYYRLGVEDGKLVCPENLTQKNIDDAREKDPWTYNTQVMNNPRKASSVEFSSYKVPTFELDYDINHGWRIFLQTAFSREEVYLKDCDIVIAGDPAASVKQHSSRTSRYAMTVLARDSKDRKFILEIKRGFIAPEEFFDWLFSAADKWRILFRKTVVEGQGPFKILEPILRTEETRRKKYLHLQVIGALGDKDTTIRNILQPELERGLLFVNEHFERELLEELFLFPQSSKKDVLDTIKLAIYSSFRPDNVEEKEEINEFWQKRKQALNANTGY